MIDFGDIKNYKPSTVRLFVDVDVYSKEFLVYVIDCKLKTIIAYKVNSVIDTKELIYKKIEQFHIGFIDLYTREGVLFNIYEEFKDDYLINIRDDIYKWRKRLPLELRYKTLPIYFYEVHDYRFVKEDEYVELLKVNEN
jgi:hypothetical protein